MFITRKHLSRRAVLRGLGASVALPFLEAMVPAGVRAQAAVTTPRLGFFYFPHGAILLANDDRWSPAAAGKDFELSPILQPFAPFKSKVNIVSGLRNKPAESPDPHGITPGTWLRCVAPGAPDGGTTADQIAAAHIGQSTTFPSIEVAAEGKPGPAGVAGSGFGDTISFRTPTQPLPMEYNPRKLFYKLFGKGDNDEERKQIIAETGSILDFTLDRAASLRRELGARDRTTLASYLDSVREVERRVQKMKEQDLSALDLPEPPLGEQADFRGQQRMMFDLIALAFQGNLTRVANYMMAAEGSMKAYTHLGISEAFHPLSHHGEDPTKLEQLQRLQTYHCEIFAEFMQKLDAMEEADGTVLDNSLLLFGSNMSNSDMHDNAPLPAVVAGGGSGRCKTGQHLRYAADTPHANLLLTMLVRAGVPVESFGDSSGDFAEI
ncbi:MAG: DUF1552 domain-containing protein [Gammaproteobacteria bacterium]|nr:DUF1552 domain-containing protein [Gammaproteobacteria bacterium]